MTSDQFAEAHALLSDPSRAASVRPGYRRAAWAALKAARGQTVCQTNLNILARAYELGMAAYSWRLAPLRAGAGATPEDAA